MADALALVGATGVGKTELSLDVARRLGGEIISMDSRQVYRGMDIGTAKATPAERAKVPHHGLDLVDPDVRYSAGRFSRDARGWIDEIRGRGRVPVLVGGTGFFLRALTHPMFREPPMDRSRRERLQRYLERLPAEDLRRWLATLDPEGAERLRHRGGQQRVLRSLEVVLLSGRTLGWWHRNSPSAEEPVDVVVFVLERPREELYRRIDQRVDQMLEAGWLDEIRGLLASGYDRDDPGMNGTGYREMIAYEVGEMGLGEAKEKTRTATRRYARRQLTWFRKKLPPNPVRLDARRPVEDLAQAVVERWEAAA